MNDTFFVSIVTFAYFSAAFVFLVSFIFEKKYMDTAAVGITSFGLMLHTLALLFRWVHSYQLGIGHAPLSNFYESLIFFSWSLVFIFMMTKKR